MSNVRDYGAVGDGRADDTAALEHAANDGDGVVELPRGEFRITRPVVVKLRDSGRFALHGNGGTAKIVMAGAGPAISLVGTHTGSADPKLFQPEVWQRERMPTISEVEIQGAHPAADGIRIEGVMQPTLTGLLIREVRTAVHITKRARNVLISHCHIYKNTGVGVHLDNVNLHQTIISGSHISYCRLGGIRIENSEIRNLQITGNDIEYNNNRTFQVPGADAEPTAEIYIDCGSGSVREGTIASNTIQATYSPGGANIRFIGTNPQVNHKVGLFTIAGNMIGSQDNNIHLTAARGVTISGNIIYSGHGRNLLVENSRNIVIGDNVFDHNPDYEPNQLCTGIRLVDNVDCSIAGVLIQDCLSGKHTVKDAGVQAREALIEIVRCKRLNISGVQVLDAAPYGMSLHDCSDTLITGCTILDGRDPKLMQAAIKWTGSGNGNLIGHCRLASGPTNAIAAEASVRQWNNLVS